jgi:hypothetical protein
VGVRRPFVTRLRLAARIGGGTQGTRENGQAGIVGMVGELKAKSRGGEVKNTACSTIGGGDGDISLLAAQPSLPDRFCYARASGLLRRCHSWNVSSSFSPSHQQHRTLLNVNSMPITVWHNSLSE